MNVYMYISVCICMYMYVYVCICMCMYVYVCICMFVYICMYVCIYLCMYVCICMYVCMSLSAFVKNTSPEPQRLCQHHLGSRCTLLCSEKGAAELQGLLCLTVE